MLDGCEREGEILGLEGRCSMGLSGRSPHFREGSSRRIYYYECRMEEREIPRVFSV
jgi:hypothetical protein